MARTQQVGNTTAGKNVNLRPELYDRVKAYTTMSNLEIKDFVNSVVEETLERYESMRDNYPDFKVVGMKGDDAYVIADMSKKVLATVEKKNEFEWHCDVCEAIQCPHVSYVLLLPKMIKLADMFVRLLRQSEITVEKTD